VVLVGLTNCCGTTVRGVWGHMYGCVVVGGIAWFGVCFVFVWGAFRVIVS
jgi:hypothetical protein